MARSLPFIGLLLIIGGASLAFGSDSPIAALFVSSLVILVCGVVIVAHRGAVGGWAVFALIGAGVLYGIGVAKGWASAGAHQYAVLAAMFATFAVAQIAARKASTFETLWRATVLMGALIAGASFVDFIVDPSRIWGIASSHASGGRLATPFVSPNTAATFFGLISILSFTDLVQVVRRFEPGGPKALERLARAGVIPLSALILCLSCVVLTASRAGVTLLAAALMGLTIWEIIRQSTGDKPIGFKAALIAMACVALAGCVFAISGDLYADRLSQTSSLDTARANMFRAYINALDIAPILGHGLGGFGYVSALIADAENARTLTYTGAAHNVVLQWLLQGGVVGLAFVLAISLAWILIMRRGLIVRSRQTGYLRGAVAAAMFVAAHGMVDYALEITAFGLLFAWVCGLGAGAATGGSQALLSRPGSWHSRARKVIFVSGLLLAATLAFWAFLDRASVERILNMEEEQFRSAFLNEGDLSGSPVRLEAIGDRALRLDPPNAELAAQAFAYALTREPRDGMLEVRFATARIIAAGTVTPDAVAALTRSYYLTPYARPRLVTWRLNLVEQLWDFLPPLVREAAIREARAYGQVARIERLNARSGVVPNETE